MLRLALVAIYLTGLAVAVVLLNANTGVGELAIAIWAVVSVLLGWGTGNFAFALLAFVAIPFAVPFGVPDNYQYSEPLPIWWTAAVLASASACLICVSALVKSIVEALRHQRASS